MLRRRCPCRFPIVPVNKPFAPRILTAGFKQGRGVRLVVVEPSGLHPKQLTARITRVSSVCELVDLLRQHGKAMNGIHAGASWNKAASEFGDKNLRSDERNTLAAELLRALPMSSTRRA